MPHIIMDKNARWRIGDLEGVPCGKNRCFRNTGIGMIKITLMFPKGTR